jgi:hypothetical protein
VALNRQAWGVAAVVWRGAGLRLFPILATKLGAFWLSTDQLFHLSNFGLRNRLIRRAGALAYLLLLGAAIIGWLRLRVLHPNAAAACFFASFYSQRCTCPSP